MSDQQPPTYVDRVEDDTVLVMGGQGAAHRSITVWRQSDRTCWWVTDNGADVARRKGMRPAVNAALALLGVDPPTDPVTWTDER